MRDGLRLALTTLTVLPVKPGRIDRRSAAVAMGLAPLVGALLGLALAGVHAVLPAGLLGAALTVAAGVLLTRGLHLDGLADTVDALGSYRSGDAALEIMKKPDIGPFGVAAIALTLVIQTAAVAEAGAAAPTEAGAGAGAWAGAGAVAWAGAGLGAGAGAWSGAWAIVVAWATGRLGVTLACRRGVPAARPGGLGALVASTVPVPVAAALTLAVAAAAIPAVPGRPWAGPAVVAGVVLALLLLLRHAVRRFGGITGDVLGAATELATTLTLVALVLT
ncbi:adenosylcobinamide-GDP ribazoletransferase [Couchioplanes azureus]|uniref:adenosylcobinamide-GDP ribazoletransferase n=1 Tax=Couchioplanes caeruleus TaxID=56438 RepID=UPI001670FFAA|nr:adenosylcobinamide-GDP ribazoletransferase [Couchioplanes caeruleus]GGQ52880.1 adenosylcobinamide-GDP ribazoletransferase [Couchioplanes caeruleus subsp. azureus]